MEAEPPDVVDAQEALEGALKELDAAYVDLPQFREEAGAALAALAESDAHMRGLYEGSAALNNKVEATRRAAQELRAEEEELLTSLKTMQDDTARNVEETGKAGELVAHSLRALGEVKGRLAGLEALKAMGADWSSDQLVQKQRLEERLLRGRMESENAVSLLTTARHEVDLLVGHLEEGGRVRSTADKEAAGLREQIDTLKLEALQLARQKEHRERDLRGLLEGNGKLTLELRDKASASEAGAKDVRLAQEALARERAIMDKGVDAVEELATRARRLRGDLDAVMASNVSLAKEMAEVGTNLDLSRAEAVRARKEGEKAGKLMALTAEKIKEGEGRLAEVEGALARTHAALLEVDARAAAKGEEAEAAKARLADVKREADVLSKSLLKAEDKVKAAALALAFQQGTKRSLAEAINGYTSAVRRLRAQLQGATEERDRVAQEVDEAGRAYFAAVEGVKLQELQASALQKGIDELHGKLSSQASLYEAVKADRNAYAKSLHAMQDVLSDLKQQFKALSARIEALKSSITAKDTALVKEHFEHHRVEKDKATLKGELARLAKAVTSCDHVAGVQEQEVAKLNTIISNADEEAGRQRAELGAVAAERQLLQSQLVKRDAELSAVYEKLRVQKSMLANGAAAYAKRVVERDALAAKVASLKGELLLASTSGSDTTALERECAKLEEELHGEEAKHRVMLDAMDKPMNVHRWRALADKDPPKWDAIQRIHGLQRRLLATRDEVRVKEAHLAERRREEEEAKEMLTKLPPPEDAKAAIAAIHAALKAKAGQIKGLEGDIDAARGHVSDITRELARIQEAQDALGQEWVRRAKGGARRRTGAGGALAAAAAAASALEGKGGEEGRGGREGKDASQ